MEKAPQQINQYDRQPIRLVVRDDLQQLHQVQQQPTTKCIAAIVRDERQQALGAHRCETPVQQLCVPQFSLRTRFLILRTLDPSRVNLAFGAYPAEDCGEAGHVYGEFQYQTTQN
ncbi:hypothetical protein HPB52_008278 [Rhipicephalus sanguineus]|uniref:Uncharacterized protein n=1 Tax=Rhipicephalus sanguineus TaxID=34632 RepID=A0A9D4SS07_RHISA|nr:hypothetical protein HPB52_008278 [Rhipicephalus sanguineus]